jgi:predicted ATPase
VIATSNRKPTISTRTALQRDRFLPFIDLIKQRLEILELGGRRLPPGSAAQLRCLPDAGGAS